LFAAYSLAVFKNVVRIVALFAPGDGRRPELAWQRRSRWLVSDRYDAHRALGIVRAAERSAPALRVSRVRRSTHLDTMIGGHSDPES
jgi:hypothetical protein